MAKRKPAGAAIPGYPREGQQKTQALQKAAFLVALEKCLGVVSKAAIEVGIHRATHYDWKKNDEAYAQAVQEIEDLAVDFGESLLHAQMAGVPVLDASGKPVPGQYIKPPDTTAIIFFLKCKGKRRGYVERLEITPPPPDGLNEMSDEDLAKERALLERKVALAAGKSGSTPTK